MTSALQMQRAGIAGAGDGVTVAPRAPGSSAVHDGSDAIDHVVAHGLLGEQGKHIMGGNSEPVTSAAQTAGIQRAVNDRSKGDGSNSHGEISFAGSGGTSVLARESESSKLGDARLEQMLSEWWHWVDQEFAIEQREEEHFDLESLAAPTCESASATDRYFVESLIEATYFDDGEKRMLLSKPGRERALKLWEKYIALRPAFGSEELAALREHIRRRYPDENYDVGSHVQIISDRSQVFPGGDARAFARDYLRSLPIGWSESVTICLSPGHSPTICRWTAERVSLGTTQIWAKGLPLVAGAQRFVALEAYVFGGDVRVMIPASTVQARAASIQELAAPAPVQVAARPVVIYSTGIAPLDAVLSAGGIPSGSRVVIQAATAQGKSSILFEIAESLAARGQLVAWLATSDEPRESVMARRRQRAGMSRADALRSVDESALNPALFVIDGRTVALEEVLACSSQISALFIDPISKFRTVHQAADPVAQIRYALRLVEESGLTVYMSAPLVRGAERRTKTERAFGGNGVETGANLLLEVRRSGADLTLEIIKSRGLGGEGQELALKLDADGQRVLPAGVAVSSTDRIWDEVRRALSPGEPRSARSLAEGAHKVAGRATTIRAVIRARLGSGELVEVDGKLAVPVV